MIHLFLTSELAYFVAEHLPPDDPLRTGIAELLAEQECLGGVQDEPAALAVYVHGRMHLEIYNEAAAKRTLEVLDSPRAYPAVLDWARRTRAAAAVDTLAETLGIEPGG